MELVEDNREEVRVETAIVEHDAVMERLMKLQKKVTKEKNECRELRKECERVIQKWDDIREDYSKELKESYAHKLRTENWSGIETSVRTNMKMPRTLAKLNERTPVHCGASLPGKRQHYLPRSMSRGSVCL